MDSMQKLVKKPVEKDAERWRVSSGSHCEHACCLKEAQEERELVGINSHRGR